MSKFAEPSVPLAPRSTPQSPAEEYKLKRQEKIQAKDAEKQKRRIKKTAKKAGVVLLVLAALLLFGGGWYLVSKVEPAEKSDIVSRTPIHWHPELKIKILGEYQEIPANIGIGIVHQTLHTHDPDGIIHIEPTGLVRENDIKLGRFFEIWGKTFNESCIFEYCSGPQGQVKMFVNGEPNFDFENYIMRDGDRIEIIFE
ncbi:MAG: hypothetical protein G01um101430_378 [Parcubacteria group bacterium Gr01-1014_30]|nr:MAG: hypothetical protein G01um101430_378 [Parcubacteria group bacterium Gr01-1014_30]